MRNTGLAPLPTRQYGALDLPVSSQTLSRPEEAPPRQRIDACVATDDLSIAFGDRLVVDSVSLAVPRGEIFGLIGPSGCGKSTIVKALLGLVRPSGGRVKVLGTNPAEFGGSERKRIGYTPQGFNLYPTLTVWENANFVAGLYGIGPFERRRRIRELLQFLELWDARKRLARDISGGMQRRLSLACALIHRPELLFVDEPTAGLDPVLRAKIWDHLGYLRDRGTAVVVTTQYIDEATSCDRVGILNQGRLVSLGTPSEIRHATLGADALDVRAANFTRDDVAALWSLAAVQRVDWVSAQALRVTVDEVAEGTAQIGAALGARGVEVESIHTYTPTFEDVFLAVVGASK